MRQCAFFTLVNLFFYTRKNFYGANLRQSDRNRPCQKTLKKKRWKKWKAGSKKILCTVKFVDNDNPSDPKIVDFVDRGSLFRNHLGSKNPIVVDILRFDGTVK